VKRGAVVIRLSVVEAHRLRAVLDALERSTPADAATWRSLARVLDQLANQLRGPTSEPRFKA
jgi:hypothetical protein